MYNFKFADVGEGIHEAVIFEWYFKEGDTVEKDQNLYSVETDKFTTDIPSPVAGKIAKIYYEAGADVCVGDVVVDIDDGSGHSAGTSEPAPTKEESAKEEGGKTGAAVVGAIEVSDEIIESFDSAPKKAADGNKSLATPVARNFAKQLGVNINEVIGTGSMGRVTKEDIQKFVDGEGSASKSETASSATYCAASDSEKVGDVERVPMTKIRETIAKNMTKSKYTIPHTSTMFEFDVTELWDLRKEVNGSLEKDGVKLSFMPFIIKALVAALKKHPIMNSELDEENREILIKKFYNIGIAVDTEHGLSVPIIRDADKKSMLELHEQVKLLAKQAEDKTLPLDSMTGGTFTITNYGSVGGMFGTPVINHPESAILGIGAIYKKPVYNEQDKIVPRYVLPVSMSFDHRTIDGADANRFAIEFGKILSSRTNILLN